MHSHKLVTLVCVSHEIMVDLFILVVCFFVRWRRGFNSSFIFLLAFWLAWLTTVGAALSLCQSFLLSPAQLIAGVAETVTKLHNYGGEGVDRNSSLTCCVVGGDFTLTRCTVGGFFYLTVTCVIHLIIID